MQRAIQSADQAYAQEKGYPRLFLFVAAKTKQDNELYN